MGEVLIPLRHCWRMLFSAFALAVDGFVTIRRRTAQFFFCLLMGCLFLGSPPSPPYTPNACNKKGTLYLGRGLGNRSGLKF